MRTPRLIAVAHGSRDPRAGATVDAILELVRRSRPDLAVRTAYLDHAPPTLAQVLSRGDDAVVLPLLLTAAWHSRVDIPGALREVASRRPRLRVRYGEPLGPHPLLLRVLERRLAEAGVRPGDPDAAVVLVSAGSSDSRANAVIEDLATSWAGWWRVMPAYASAASPTPEEAVVRLRWAGAPRVVIAPYLLAPGYFADKVRRSALAAGADVIAPVLGAAPEIAEILVQRYDEALREVPAAATA